MTDSYRYINDAQKSFQLMGKILYIEDLIASLERQKEDMREELHSILNNEVKE